LKNLATNVGIGTNDPIGKLSIKGNSGGNPDNPLFEVSDEFGNPVFTITSEGVRIYIKEYAKGASGGFAVGKYGIAKGIPDTTFLLVTPDSTRMFTSRFAKGVAQNFLKLTEDNYFIGHQAGENNITGVYNVFIGYQSGLNNTFGSKNYFIGYKSGYNNITGYSNVFIGDSAGYTNNSGYHNVFMGNQSGQNNTIGNYNVASGYKALFNNSEGDANSAYGEYTLYSNTTGDNNTAIGLNSMFYNEVGSNNTASGWNSMVFNSEGNGNTALGYMSLYSNAIGNGNTAIGTLALWESPLAVNNTAIGFNAFATPNNYGNSTALGANAQINNHNKVRIGDVNVTVIEGQVGLSVVSDGRFKTNVKDEVKGLDFIMKLHPVVYNFDTQKLDAFLMKDMPDSLKNERMSKNDYAESIAIRHTGFIAQEVEKAAIESVFVFDGIHHPTDENDNYSLVYSLFTVPLVKAVQELNEKNEAQQKEIQNLIEKLKEYETLKAEFEVIENELDAFKSEIRKKK
jgi:hypothetical protein